jgi:transposase InsO family protein
MIRQLRTEFPEVSVRMLCAVLGVSRSWYYETLHQPSSCADEVLVAEIERIIRDHPGYGYRRVTAELRRQGAIVNHKRVLRLMQKASLLCQVRRYVQTTRRDPSFQHAPNLLRIHRAEGPNQIWVADVTYLHFPQGTGFLACVLDAWSRRCIGWAVSDRLTTDLTEGALIAAIKHRSPKPGLIHHSDQGVQYANHRYLRRLQNIGAQVSMSAVATPTDNALIESFFSTLKREEVWTKDYQHLADAKRNLQQFIELEYNQRRLHSSLGYRPPAEFEQVAL